MAVVSSCCEAWPWVAKRTQPVGSTFRGVPGSSEASFAPHPGSEPCWGTTAEVKSIWPRSVGPHTCHKGACNGSRRRRPERAPNTRPSSDRGLQVVRAKPKPLVIVHQDVTVKQDRALHTPPITLGKCGRREGVGASVASTPMAGWAI
jgi:hypothetical protein